MVIEADTACWVNFNTCIRLTHPVTQFFVFILKPSNLVLDGICKGQIISLVIVNKQNGLKGDMRLKVEIQAIIIMTP